MADQAAVLQRLRDAQAQGGDAFAKIVGHEEAAAWGNKAIGDDWNAAVSAFGASDLESLGSASQPAPSGQAPAPSGPPVSTTPGGPAPTAPGMVAPAAAGNTAPAMVGVPRQSGAGFAGVASGGGRGGNLGTRPNGGGAVDVFLQVAAAQGGRMY